MGNAKPGFFVPQRSPNPNSYLHVALTNNKPPYPTDRESKNICVRTRVIAPTTRRKPTGPLGTEGLEGPLDRGSASRARARARAPCIRPEENLSEVWGPREFQDFRR
jgi:hypothetical protein